MTYVAKSTWSVPFLRGLVSALIRDIHCEDSPVPTGVEALRELLSDLEKGDLLGAVSRKAKAPSRDKLSYFTSNLASTLLKKSVGLAVDPGKGPRTDEKWWASEFSCKRTNERFQWHIDGVLPSAAHWEVHDFLVQVRKRIARWLGRLPNLDQLDLGFGPGATYGDRGKLSTLPDKLSSNPTLTPSLWAIGPLALSGSLWSNALSRRSGSLETVRGCRFTAVPKTARIDRPIAIEPSLNMFVQLGLGRKIRDRLRAFGWDLLEAQPVHRRVARDASRSREFCTIDLESASDTVAKNLVRFLLPRDWFHALNRARSSFVEKDGRTVYLEKFSSMGNGATFELETLIFAAISCEVTEKLGYRGLLGQDVFVYGDDIIVPDPCFRALKSVLEYCGFSVNAEKSFHGDTPFRESCGGDYLLGVDVRGLYLKESPDDDPAALIALHNQLVALNARFAHIAGAYLDNAIGFVRNSIPAAYRRAGPRHLGDLVLHSDVQSQWTLKRRGNRILIRTVQCVPRQLPWKYWSSDVQLCCATLGYGDGRAGVTPRNSPSSVELRWVELERLPS